MRIEKEVDDNEYVLSVVADNNEHDDDENRDEDKYKSKGGTLARPCASHTAPDLIGLRFSFIRGGRQEQ